jgi:hypothetical protein
MKKSVWIVYDPHGEQLDICEDELTAYAVKKHWDWKIIEPCSVREYELTTRSDVDNIVLFEPDIETDEDIRFIIETRYDA